MFIQDAVRSGSSSVVALIVTLALFWLMYSLIAVPPEYGKSLDFNPIRFAIDPPQLDPVTTRTPPEPLPEHEQIERPPKPINTEHVTSMVEEFPVLSDMPSLSDVTVGFSKKLTPSLPDQNTMQPLFPIAPQYPRAALIAGIEGWVKVTIEVDATGNVVGVSIIDASPRGTFDASVRRAVTRWKFTELPDITSDQLRYVTTTLKFSLDEENVAY